MKHSTPWRLILLGPWLAFGCAHTEKEQSVSYKFVDPTNLTAAPAREGNMEVKRGETVFVDARPIQPLATPRYPIEATPKTNATVTIVVRIVVGADGRVENVRRSIANLAAPTPLAEACFEAVEAAVGQWRFEPAQLAVVAPQPNGRPRIISSAPTERPFEVAFTFSAAGGVRSEFAKEASKKTVEK